MKPSRTWLAALMVIGVMIWWILSHLSFHRTVHQQIGESMTMAHVRTYVGTEPGWRVRFQYPEGWVLREERGQVERYRQVRIMGPRNHEDSYTCYLSVLAAPLQDAGGRFPNTEAFVQNYTSHLAQGATVVSSQPISVDRTKATELIATYTMPPWHHQGVKAIAVPVKVRTVVLEQPPYLYQLTYSADAREYDAHAAAFEQLLTTFQLP